MCVVAVFGIEVARFANHKRDSISQTLFVVRRNYVDVARCRELSLWWVREHRQDRSGTDDEYFRQSEATTDLEYYVLELVSVHAA